MAGMTTGYLNLIADYAATQLSHIGLVDDTDTELTAGSYARLAVTWTSASGGTIRPNADLTFEVGASETVSGWRAYTAITAGTEYGGADFASDEVYSSAGQFKLLSASSGILHSVA
jgi:hypothetical protein